MAGEYPYNWGCGYVQNKFVTFELSHIPNMQLHFFYFLSPKRVTPCFQLNCSPYCSN